MLGINTNLSSLIAQNSLKQSTNKLNTAIERMSTGCKINHAKDNAANYSISTNMTTKIGAYQVAEDNALQGLDMINTASESLTLIEDKLMRLRALAEQSANGTYGAQSKQAINQEANAIVDEIERLYNTTEYNGINLAKGKVISTEESKFIKDIDRRDTSKMTTLASVAIDEALTSGTYSISTPEELAKLATMTNNGLIGAGCEFVLGADIDLSGYSNWTPIGTLAGRFKANFDGNGYIVSNVNINSSDSYQGLFGEVLDVKFSNLAVTGNLNVSGMYVGLLVGHADRTSIENCYALGEVVSTKSYAGGMVGILDRSTMKNSYFSGDLEGYYYVGGIIGSTRSSNIDNCFSEGNISGDSCIGGLVGDLAYWSDVDNSSLINSSYSSMNFVNFVAMSGGLVGTVYSNAIIKNSYSEVNSADSGIVGRHLDFNLILDGCSVQGQSTNIKALFVDLYQASNSPNCELRNCTYNSYYASKGLSYIPHSSNDSLADKVSIKDEVAFQILPDSKVFEREDFLSLQIGINSYEKSQISLSTSCFILDLSELRNIGLINNDYIFQIDQMLFQVSGKQTEYGAVQNRLESVVEEIGIQYDNLVSSRSTLRDADIAEVSAEYIQQQILQQASATLLATANQSPSIALQLI